MKFIAFMMLSILSLTNIANGAPTYDRNSWTSWRGKWTGDFWNAGNLGTSQYMTCVGVDGSWGSPEYWAAGMGDEAARDAYMQTLNWANVANRNPAYIEVHCGY